MPSPRPCYNTPRTHTSLPIQPDNLGIKHSDDPAVLRRRAPACHTDRHGFDSLTARLAMRSNVARAPKAHIATLSRSKCSRQWLRRSCARKTLRLRQIIRLKSTSFSDPSSRSKGFALRARRGATHPLSLARCDRIVPSSAGLRAGVCDVGSQFATRFATPPCITPYRGTSRRTQRTPKTRLRDTRLHWMSRSLAHLKTAERDERFEGSNPSLSSMKPRATRFVYLRKRRP